MKKLKEIFEKYKKALIALVAVILILVAWINTPNSEKIKLPEYSTRTQEEIGVNTSMGNVRLVRTNPPSGDTNPKNTDMIELTFSGDVDISELKIRTRPQISLRAKKLTSQTILIYPDKNTWQKDTYYHLTLLGIQEAKTKKPIHTVEYVYYYTEYPVTEAGESWMLNASPEELEEYSKGYAN